MIKPCYLPVKVIAAVLLCAAASVPVFAETASFQGFETGVGDWYSYNATTPIQQVASGSRGAVLQ